MNTFTPSQLNTLTSEAPSHLNTSKPMRFQIFLAILLVFFGVILITAAFFVPPMGVIDPTVLTAFGEILTLQEQ